MSSYLEQRFKGKYRILADYDQATNDWIRDANGELDKDYNDYYIKCANKIRIKDAYIDELKNGYRHGLWCYIPTKQRGMNILRQIYEDKIGGELPVDIKYYPQTVEDIKENKRPERTYDEKYLVAICKSLVSNGVLIDAEVLDTEVYFTFKLDLMDYIATLVKPQTSGANIGATSTRNLPKSAYKIPDKDLKARKEIIKISQGDMERIQYISKIDDIYTERLPRGYKGEMKSKCMKLQQYIHSLGLWEDYLKFLKETVDK